MLLASCSIDEVVRLLKRADMRYMDRTDSPFEIKAINFRDFAIEDSKNDSVHSRVNALSNVKRAIECRIDEILYGLCLHVKSERENWNFPKKIQVLEDLGILAPRILEKINRKRNQLEHSYVEPTQEDVEDALDVATLFIGYTSKLQSILMSANCGSKSVVINRRQSTVEIKEGKNVRKVIIGDEDDWLEVARFLMEQA